MPKCKTCTEDKSQYSAKSYSTLSRRMMRSFRMVNLLSKRSLRCPYRQKLTLRKRIRTLSKRSFWTRPMSEIGASTKESCRHPLHLANLLRRVSIEKVSLVDRQIILIKSTNKEITPNLGNSIFLISRAEEETWYLILRQVREQRLRPHLRGQARWMIVVALQGHRQVQNLATVSPRSNGSH